MNKKEARTIRRLSPFWSLTGYDNETRSLIQNDLGRPLVGSVHGAEANKDGSFDLYFGPEKAYFDKT